MSFHSASATVSGLVESVKSFPSIHLQRRHEALRVKAEHKKQKERDEAARRKADEHLLVYAAAREEFCELQEVERLIKDNLIGRLRNKSEYFEQDAATIENTTWKNDEHQVFPKAIFHPPEDIDSYGDIRQYLRTPNIGSTIEIGDYDFRHTKVGLPADWEPADSPYLVRFDAVLTDYFPLSLQNTLSLNSSQPSSLLSTKSRESSIQAVPYEEKSSRRSTNASRVSKPDEILTGVEDEHLNPAKTPRTKFAPPVEKTTKQANSPKLSIFDAPECYLDEKCNIHWG